MSTFRYKNSKNWWYDFQFDGRRYRESTKTSSRTLAREAERARRRQLEEGFNSIKKREKPKSFPEAAAEYIAAKGLTLKSSSLRIEKRSIVRLP